MLNTNPQEKISYERIAERLPVRFRLFYDVFNKLKDCFCVRYGFLGFGFFEVVMRDTGRQAVRITGSDVIFIKGMSYA